MPNQISKQTKELIEDYKEVIALEKSYNKTDGEKIKVHQVSSKIAFLYERIRNAVDYKDEHLLRKNAIERILKRRLSTEKNELNVAKFLIFELIRAKYLPENEIPEKRIYDIKEIIEKYTLLINEIPEKSDNGKIDSEYLFDWLVGVAACEIEEKIVPYKRESVIIKFVRQIIDKKLKTPEKIISRENKEIQIHIAVLRNFTKSDLSLIRYRLMQTKHPEWFFAPSEELIIKLAKNIDWLVNDIEKQIDNPLGESFSRFIRKNLAFFTVLEDVVRKDPKNISKIFSHHFHIEDAIKEACVKKYKEAKTKLRRAAVRSIVYIFVTKMILALIIELPFDKYIIGHINYLALGMNLLVPPLLMLIVVLTIKVPSKKNTDLIVTGIKEMVYDKYASQPFAIKGILSRGLFFSKMFRFFYVLIFLVSFGLIIFVLKKFNFNVISIGLFLFFLSVVSYFGIRIRQGARELVVVKQKEGIISFAIDLFSIPILKMGQWLSVKLSSINIFVFILDFIIETPFKTFVEIFEEWIYYIKEERDKIR
ncbi:MAG: hypothetical protein U9N04_04960 [Patescibacteria group bacterium]|nr:hypothetical protein [Patescibacteria group bacterium]